MVRKKELSGREKAAALLISLGPELSANVFKHMKEEEIEQLTLEIANVRKISTSDRESVLKEFHQMAVASDFIEQGGIEYAKDVLERALGTQKAVDIINKLTSSLQVRPFDFIRKTDPSQLLNFIQGEHPQTIALIMAYLESEQASIILSSLPNELQADVARRIATMDRVSPDVLKEVEQVLERKLSTILNQDYSSAGGVQTVVDVLNRVDRGTEKTIMESLEIDDPELAEEIKKRMFVFEDVVLLDDRGVQQVLREIDTGDLALALKGSSEEVAEKFQKNMSQRAAEMLKEDIEYMGPVRLRDVEDAQQRIVNTIRKLEELGEIVIARGGGDEIIV
ncbi:flagellar motor switch protein FliG [Desulfitispora alkaliphila]|uniref:flagellar motor switch protein FliG n=1 Tax=Desulfitispora alkaliphila TaxID=622674 RepID=UPI003D1A3077